jgi:hypothetical protein
VSGRFYSIKDKDPKGLFYSFNKINPAYGGAPIPMRLTAHLVGPTGAFMQARECKAEAI